jgi:hypothetical protein
MKLYKTIPFGDKEQEYEIRILHEPGLINVVAFRDNYPANGYRHQIRLPNGCDVLGALESNIADDLVVAARQELSEARWDKIAPTIRQHR